MLLPYPTPRSAPRPPPGSAVSPTTTAWPVAPPALPAPGSTLWASGIFSPRLGITLRGRCPCSAPCGPFPRTRPAPSLPPTAAADSRGPSPGGSHTLSQRQGEPPGDPNLSHGEGERRRTRDLASTGRPGHGRAHRPRRCWGLQSSAAALAHVLAELQPEVRGTSRRRPRKHPGRNANGRTCQQPQTNKLCFDVRCAGSAPDARITGGGSQNTPCSQGSCVMSPVCKVRAT